MELKEKELITEQTTNQSLIVTDEIKKSKNSNSFLIFGIFTLIISLILIILYCTFTLINSKNKNMLKGLSIEGYDISNLNKEQAYEEITNYINSCIPEEIILKHNDYQTSISTAELAINFNISESIDRAYQIGRDGNLFQNNFTILKTFFNKKNIDINFSLDEEHLKIALEDISSKLPDKLIKNGAYIEGDNLIITKGSEGYVVNVNDTLNLIKTHIEDLTLKNQDIELIVEKQQPVKINLDPIYEYIYKEPVDAYYTQNPFCVYPSENGRDFVISLDEAKNMLNENKDEYIIPLKTLYPNVTTNMIGTEAFPDLLSEFSTRYAASNRNRTTNLILAANKINGTVIMPGEIFSYNEIVGARTIASGYKEAPIYINGRVEDGLGGGICQITTTLYNAALYANLEIIERSNHQFIPSYANASRDATVVYGAIDFKFKNNRDYPIKITCSVQNGIANFKIFGLRTENDYEVVLSSRITRTTATAIYSEAYKTLKQNGNVVSSQVISKDTYKRH